MFDSEVDDICWEQLMHSPKSSANPCGLVLIVSLSLIVILVSSLIRFVYYKSLVFD